MSFFGKKKEKAPTPQEAIQRIRDVEDLLGKKQAYLEKKINDELDSARKYGTKNKRSKYVLFLSEYLLFLKDL